MPNMNHNTAIKEQEQILGQSVDVEGADDGGFKQVMQIDENERPQMQQSQETAQVQEQQSQQPRLVQQIDRKQSEQPQVIQSLEGQPQVEKTHIQQPLLQQPQIHQPLQPVAFQRQPQQQAQAVQHTLSDAEVQTLCAKTIKARERAYCKCWSRYNESITGQSSS